MLREDYIRFAAQVHIDGARNLRDSAAALLPCCSLTSAATAFALGRIVTLGEELMDCAISLSGGLMNKSGLSKFTPVAEARMKLLGAELDSFLTQKQTAAFKIKTVAPGTRADVYNGFIDLSARAEKVADEFAEIADSIKEAVCEGRMTFAVPLGALEFLRLICADYGAACKKLAQGEEACSVRRSDACDAYKKCLQHAVAAQGNDCFSATSEALASLSSCGAIPSLPPVLFDILLRYENLPATVHSEFVNAEHEYVSADSII